VSLTLGGSAANVYTIYGDEDNAMSFPPALQTETPFGANVGGLSPALVAQKAEAGLNSWLTVGIIDGDSAGALGKTGLDWDLIINEGTCGIDIEECASRPLVQTATVSKKPQDMAATEIY
jgi:hypothetical protein